MLKFQWPDNDGRPVHPWATTPQINLQPGVQMRPRNNEKNSSDGN